MKIHLIGHASLFVETSSCRILIDPVFWDPHGEGIADIHPRREVLLERLPRFDLLILSHRHLDHLDVRTLSRLPRGVHVLIPQDPLLEATLRRLGYTHVRAVRPLTELPLGPTTLLTTPSLGSVQEFGILLKDDSGVVWNQIDTVVDAEIIKGLLARHGEIDLMLAMWQPMLELSYQSNQSLAFPFSEYARILYTISLLSPRALAPGANGFLYRGGSTWLNHLVFPVTRERFCSDVKEACPRVKDAVFTFDPGDVIQVAPAGIEHARGACPFVRRLFDAVEPYSFSPVQIDGNFLDKNPDGHEEEGVRRVVTDTITRRLPELITAERASFLEHRRWGVIYELAVAFPGGIERWVLDFSEEPVQARAVSSPSPLANLFVYITASALFGLGQGITGWDHAHMGGYYRTYQKIYKVTPHGLIRPEHAALRDPLALLFPYEGLLEAVIATEIARWSPPDEGSAGATG